MDPKLSISIFSRHSDLLRLLSALLSRQSGIEVVSASTDPLEFTEQVKLRKPAVALLDDFMVPDLVYLCREVAAAFDKTALVILRSPLGVATEVIPADLRHLELQKPLRVPALIQRLAEFVNSTRLPDSSAVEC